MLVRSVVLLLGLGSRFVGGWIALSKDGYMVTKNLALDNGTVVEGDFLAKGIIQSANRTWRGPDVTDPDLCTADRLGALRWSAKSDFEGCDGLGNWAPIKLCDRFCGFKGPPVPTLRPGDQGGVSCSNTECTYNCMIKLVNKTLAPTLGEEECAELMTIGGENTCVNVTVAETTMGMVDPMYATDPAMQDAVVCGGVEEIVCVTKVGEQLCTEVARDFYPWVKTPGIHRAASMYTLGINALKSPLVGWLYGLKGQIVEVIFDGSGLVVGVDLLGDSVAFDAGVRIWTDLGLGVTAAYIASALAREILFSDLTRVPTVWEIPEVAQHYQVGDPTGLLYGELPDGDFETRKCAALDFSSPAFDYLKIFYNVSGWEALLPVKRDEKENVTIHAQCDGLSITPPPWLNLDVRVHNVGMTQTVSSGSEALVPVNRNGTDSPTVCRFEIEPPRGFAVSLNFSFIELNALDQVVVVVGDYSQVEKEPWRLLFNYTAGVNSVKDLRRVTAPYYNTPISIQLFASNETVTRGFVAVVSYVSRIDAMRETANATTLQFALATLEAQGAHLPSFGWTGHATLPASKLGTPPVGNGGLGIVSDAESCFLCCFLTPAYDPWGPGDRLREEAAGLDGAPIPTTWMARPRYLADVGSAGELSKSLVMTVRDEELPGVVAYHGYTGKAFVRTQFVSQYPPGTVKAPHGSPLGVRKDYMYHGLADPSRSRAVEREVVGWGMETLQVELGGGANDRGDHGWGDGWRDGDRPGEGEHWEDGDGANDYFFPGWQIVSPIGAFQDARRWDYDLDHPDLALFSFVDSERRVVIASEMTLAVPCGVKVNNTCGVGCDVVGTGLNRLQCIAHVAVTWCNQPVVDECNNECGAIGTMHCQSALLGAGAVTMRSPADHNAGASFRFTVGVDKAAPNLARSREITGLGVEGVEVLGEGSEFAHGSVGDGVFDDVDNGLVMSYQDPTEDVTHAISYGGQNINFALDATELDTLRFVPLDMPIPRDCIGTEATCKLQSVSDDAVDMLEWVNPLAVPWWDESPEDKRVQYAELKTIVAKNIKLLTLLFLDVIPACKRSATCANSAQSRLADRLMRTYGIIPNNLDESYGTPGHSCSSTPKASSAPFVCVMSLMDLLRMKGELEASRLRLKNLVFARPRFDMAKIKRMGSSGGIEFASPDPTITNTDNHKTNTLVFSTRFEATGEYQRIGSSRYINATRCKTQMNVECYNNVSVGGVYEDVSDGTSVVGGGWFKEVQYDLATCAGRSQIGCAFRGTCNVTECIYYVQLDIPSLSHVFIDGVIDEPCPMSFSAGGTTSRATTLCVEPKRRNAFGRPLVTPPATDPMNPQTSSGARVVNLPDVSGLVITSGNTVNVSALPGLRKRSSLTPFRYESQNVKTLDDGRTVAGTRYWYRKYQGEENEVCGTHQDGTPIACKQLKIQYDALEGAASSGDEMLIFTGERILQGELLTHVVPTESRNDRMSCAAVGGEGGCASSIGGSTINLVPRKVFICTSGVKNSLGYYRVDGTDPPTLCPGEFDALFCSFDPVTASAGNSVCSPQPIWGNTATPWNGVAGYQAQVARWKDEELAPADWFLYPIDDPTKTVTACDDPTLMASSKYAFLHIYYATPKGGEYRHALNVPGLLTDEHTLTQTAALYLRSQGVLSVRGVRVDDLLANPALEFPVTTAEKCFICCQLFGDDVSLPIPAYNLQDFSIATARPALIDKYNDTLHSTAFLADLAAIESHFDENAGVCGWLNVSGSFTAERLQGAYQLLPQTSFGKPAWKQTPGDYYLHFLPAACTGRAFCGEGYEAAASSLGPAWVIGTAVGADHIVARLPIPPLYYNSSIHTLTENNTRFLSPAALFSPELAEGRWLETPEKAGGAWGEAVARFECTAYAMHRYATTAVWIADARSHGKISFPDAEGTIITSGNLHEISRLGVQVSPITGTTSRGKGQAATATRLKFGVGWRSVNITAAEDTLAITAQLKGFPYCTIPSSRCLIPSPGESTTLTPECTLPVANSDLKCVWKDGGPTDAGLYGVDGVIVPDPVRDDCVSVYLTHDYYWGGARLTAVPITQISCMAVELGGDPTTWVETIDLSDPKYATASPPYWGIGGSPQAACPKTLPYYNAVTDEWDVEECWGYREAGCQDACLRNRTCIGALQDRASGRCQRLFGRCLLADFNTGLYTFLRNTSMPDGNSFLPARLSTLTASGAPPSYPFLLAARVYLDDLPGTEWVVGGSEEVREACPQWLEERTLCGGYHFEQPLQLTWNISVKTRVKMCTASGEAHEMGRASRNATILTASYNASVSSEVALTVDDYPSFSGAQSVRTESGHIYTIAPGRSTNIVNTTQGTMVLVPYYNRSVDGTPSVGSLLYAVEGGAMNITNTLPNVKVPHGIYSLANISYTVNALLSKALNGTPFAASAEVRDTFTGVCGETPHGASRAHSDFHCAPASRYVQLSGRVAGFGGGAASVDDALHFMAASTLLPALGIPIPDTAYSFGREQHTPYALSPAARHHEVTAGAGYLASGYGTSSGYGLGGVAGWTRYIPADKETYAQHDTQPLAWCWAGDGYICRTHHCCAVPDVVATPTVVLGATRTSDGGAPRSNTLGVPSSADGILLSTGNLEDITVDSAAMSGLRVHALKEHSTGRAAVIGGWLEMGTCNTLFGGQAGKDCAQSPKGARALALNGDKALSVQSYRWQTFWAAINNASSPLAFAARAENGLRWGTSVWARLSSDPREMAAVNRTFSSSQDAHSRKIAGETCISYCGALMTLEKQEAAVAAAFLSTFMASLDGMVALRISDSTIRCVAVKCTTDLKSYHIDASPDALAQCQGACTGSCSCDLAYQKRTCAQMFSESVGGMPAVKRWEKSGEWELCVKALELEFRLANPGVVAAQDCGGVCLPNDASSCCTNNKVFAVVANARADLDAYLGLNATKDFIALQVLEGESECICSELAGYVIGEGGRDDVINHRCASMGTGHPNVCESVAKNRSGFEIRLGDNGTDYRTTLLFADGGGGRSDHLMVPHASGNVLTTGNLEAITKEAGSMSSLHVSGHTSIVERVMIGVVGEDAKSQGSREAHSTRTTVLTSVSPHCQGHDKAGTLNLCHAVPELDLVIDEDGIRVERPQVDGWAVSTQLSFASATAGGEFGIDFPTWDADLCTGHPEESCTPRDANGTAILEGRVITTGNLGDISELDADLLDVQGVSSFRGLLQLGSGYYCTPEGRAKWGAGYGFTGWSAFPAAECSGITVDFESAAAVVANATECKALCEAKSTCGAVAMRKRLDRGLVRGDERCVLVDMFATDCRVVPKQGQDLLLLVREAPSPWYKLDGNDAFFDVLCSNPRTNLTQVPGTPVSIPGYVNGDITWRTGKRNTWRVEEHHTCDDVPSMAAARAAGHTVLTLSGGACKGACEADAGCGVVVVNRTTGECALLPPFQERRPLADGAMLRGGCVRVPDWHAEVHLLTGEESIRLQVAPSSNGKQALHIPDASGVVITTGNLYDVEGGVGLRGPQTMIISQPLRPLGMGAYDINVRAGAVSAMSGKEPMLIMRGCEEGSCDVFGAEMSEEEFKVKVDKYVTLGQGLPVGKAELGNGTGYQYFQTTIDFARPGSRTTGSCFGDCKGALPCQRGTLNCVAKCPGYMAPGKRPGLGEDEECSEEGANGKVCGCPGGPAFKKFGTSVCIMPTTSHPDHGRYCETRDMTSGVFLPTDPPVNCCKSPGACGTCSQFGPVTPIGSSNRISFPEATGRVVTTGNVDELDLRTVRLEGLQLSGFFDFGLQSPLDFDDTITTGGEFGWRENLEIEKWQTHILFDPVSSRVTGGLKFIFGWGKSGRPYSTNDGSVNKVSGTAVADPFSHLHIVPPTMLDPAEPLPLSQQRYCVDSSNFEWSDRVASGDSAQREVREDPARCYNKRELILPDVSGLVLTTGNLHDTPSIAIPREELHLAELESSFTVYGNVSLGRPTSYASDPFNLAPSLLPPSYSHFQTLAQMYSRIDGDIGLTLLTPSGEIPAFSYNESVWHVADYGRQRVNWQTDNETRRRTSDPGLSPFGFGPPTTEQTRHAEQGRRGDGVPTIWGTDTVKLSNPQGGGVDTALRALYRGGAPVLAITVQDASTLSATANALGDHFGYRSGLPVLQQRSLNPPSLKDSYVTANGDPGQRGVAMNGSHPVNASWCHTAITALKLFDPASTARRPTYIAMFNTWLVAQGLVLPTRVSGTPFASPGYSLPLAGRRVDDAACAAFRQDTAALVSGKRETTELGGGEWELVRNISAVERAGEYGDTCGLIEYTFSTFRAVFVMSETAQCALLDVIGAEIFKVNTVQECLQVCLEAGATCKGFDILTTVAHINAGILGECRVSHGKCVPESMASALLVGSSQTAYVATAFVQNHTQITRDCQKDDDFSRAFYDPLRAAYAIPTTTGAAAIEGQVWDSERCFVCCILPTTPGVNSARGQDLDLETYFEHYSPSGGYLGYDLGADPSVITSVRLVPRNGYPARMIGGRFQGSNTSPHAGYSDLVSITALPANQEFTLLAVPEDRQALYRYIRYVGPDAAFSDIGEVEFHQGSYQSELSSMQQGNVSYFVDVPALLRVENVQTAMLVKCAAHGLVPSMLDNQVQEISIPEAQGQMLTTGNLEDIRMELGSFAGLGVQGDAVIDGRVVLGEPGADTLLQVNSKLDGASALTFQGPLSVVGAVSSIIMSAMTADETAFFPDASGTIVVGELPPVMPTMYVASSGGVTFEWDALLSEEVTFGTPDSLITINAGLSGAVPLTFSGGAPNSPHTTAISAPDASVESMLTLPDTSGTVLTSRTMPKVLENITAVRTARLQGGVTFASGNVEIGEERGSTGGEGIGMELNAFIVGFQSLLFDGNTRQDGKTLVLSAGDPESDHDITLPDATGTVITSATFPNRFDSLRTMGLLKVSGEVIARGAAALIGLAGEASRLVVNAHLTGQYPLRFDGGLSAVAGGGAQPTTSFMMPETSRDNIITFPDVSGTIITSANLPARTVTQSVYKLDAPRLFVSGQQVTMGSATLYETRRGAFSFADITAARYPSSGSPDREGQFKVLATGGARFVTGKTKRGKATGAFLPANSSSWYYLSDRDAKVNIAKVNASQILESLAGVPLSLWRYDTLRAGNTDGAGDSDGSGEHAGALHLGPMAQSLFAAFGLGESGTRVGTSDADGVVLGAIHGLDAKTRDMADREAALRAEVERQEKEEAEQREALLVQEERLRNHAERIRNLLVAAAAASVVV